jgi:molybdopterin-guanine dinucleotide biosynthesis protein A
VTADLPGLEAAILVGHATRLPGKFDLMLEGRTVLDRVLDAVAGAGFRPTIVAVPESGKRGPGIIVDRYDRGPLGAVRTFLEARSGPFLLVGGDMPFVRPSDLRVLLARFRAGTSVVPRSSDGTFEVLFAIYDLPLARVVRYWEQGGSLHELVSDEVERGAVEWVPAREFDPRSFVDIDTPADVERWFSSRPPHVERGVTDRSGGSSVAGSPEPAE